ncbi:MAG: YceI family protein [Pseudomonadota bacterium]|uniref:YceI family protein n=1 Tax=Sphingomonas sp. ERG5 TaxID=1381597 RepID=UPI0006916B51|nr:YceI family protein [Sphingomonas sp. ERG5]
MLAATIVAAAIPAVAQTPGAAELSRITAGSYQVDPAHTQVVWTVNHLGISPLSGAFGASGGTLNIDPANPATAKVNVTFNIAEMSTTTTAFAKHLSSPDFFDTAKFPTATFTSTSVQVSGSSARITGNLTIKGVTKPVTLDAKFYGAGANPMTKKTNLGFSATASIKRSDFGLGYGVPMVGDDLDLTIHAAFTA